MGSWKYRAHAGYLRTELGFTEEHARSIEAEVYEEFGKTADSRDWDIFLNGTAEQRKALQDTIAWEMYGEDPYGEDPYPLTPFRASKSDEALVEVPLSSNSMSDSSAATSGRSSNDTSPFRKVGRVIEGPDIQSNFLGRNSQDEYIRDARAELAFALVFNLIWNGNPFRDCGPGGADIYIQSVGANETRQLVLNAQHRDSNIIVLAVVDGDTVSFIGWTPVSEVKKREWSSDDEHKGRTYTVPAEALRSMEDLHVDDSRQLKRFVPKTGAEA